MSNWNSFLGNAAGSAVGSYFGTKSASNNGVSNNADQISPFLNEKPGFWAKTLYDKPEMGELYRDSNLKQMYSDIDAYNTLYYDNTIPVWTVLTIIVIITIIIVVFVDMSGMTKLYICLGVGLAAALIGGLTHWYWCSYKYKDWGSNKQQIINSMISAFSGSQQQLSTAIGNSTYVSRMAEEYRKDPKATEKKFNSDLQTGNREAIGVWVQFADKSS